MPAAEDHIVNAVVQGTKAAQQGGIGRIDHGLAAQGGDVSTPERNAAVQGDRRERICVGEHAAGEVILENLVLQNQQLRGNGFWRAGVHQSAQELSPLLWPGGERHGFPLFLQQGGEQRPERSVVGHGKAPFQMDFSPV